MSYPAAPVYKLLQKKTGNVVLIVEVYCKNVAVDLLGSFLPDGGRNCLAHFLA